MSHKRGHCYKGPTHGHGLRKESGRGAPGGTAPGRSPAGVLFSGGAEDVERTHERTWKNCERKESGRGGLGGTVPGKSPAGVLFWRQEARVSLSQGFETEGF